MSSGVQPVFNLNEKTGGGFGGKLNMVGSVFWHSLLYLY